MLIRAVSGGMEPSVYVLFGALVMCLALVHFLIYRHVRRLQRAAGGAAQVRWPDAGVEGAEDDLAGAPSRAQLVGLERLEAAVLADPGRRDLLEILAHIYYSRGDFARAIETYELALKGDPENVASLFFLANTCFLVHDTDRARQLWRRVTDREPHSRHGQRAAHNLDLLEKIQRTTRATEP